MKVEDLLASGFTCIESFLLMSCIDALPSQYKMKITDTFKYNEKDETFCNEKDETVEHLIFSCKYTELFWKEIIK